MRYTAATPISACGTSTAQLFMPKMRTDSDDPETSTCALAQVSLGWVASHSGQRRSTEAAEDAGKDSEKKLIEAAGTVR